MSNDLGDRLFSLVKYILIIFMNERELVGRVHNVTGLDLAGAEFIYVEV